MTEVDTSSLPSNPVTLSPPHPIHHHEQPEISADEAWLDQAAGLPEPGSLPAKAYLPYHRNQAFVGRRLELLTLANHLVPVSEAANNLTKAVVITGMGGSGKTQLAIEYAYRYGRYYPGGLYWISFADAANVSDEVAARGGERGMRLFQEREKLTLAEQVARVQSEWQKPIPRLLIFDNCEDEQLALDWLPVSGGSRVLLTSRRGEWPRELPITPLPLTSLPREDSVALLQQAAEHITTADADLVAAAVGDLPLALHLAGQFLSRLKRMAPQDYVAQLQNETGLQHVSLQGKASRYSPTGHELNVARTFALSFQQLNPDDEPDQLAEQLMAHVVCFAPGEPIAQSLLLATVVEDESDVMALFTAEDALLRLVELGLLTRSGGKKSSYGGDDDTVTMHRLLVAFTQEVMGKDEAAVMIAQTTVEETLVEMLSPMLEKPTFYGKLPVAVTHLQHVTETAFSRANRAGALLLLALGRHLEEEGETADAKRFLERAFTIAKVIDERYIQGRILVAFATVAYTEKLPQELLDHAQRAGEVLQYPEVPNQTWIAEALDLQGWGHYMLGQIEQAHIAFQKTHKLSVALDDKVMIATSLSSLDMIEYELFGATKTAERHLEEAVLLYLELDDKNSAASVLANLGYSAFLQGDHERALLKYQEVLEMVRAVGNRVREMKHLIDLCQVQIELGDYATAVTALIGIRESASEKGPWTPFFYYTLAKGHLGAGDIEKALTAAQTAVAFTKEIEDPFELGHAWSVLGRVAARVAAGVNDRVTIQVRDDEVVNAVACFDQALTYFTNGNLEHDRAHTLWHWSNYEIAQGDAAKGERMRQEARGIFERLNLPLLLASMEDSLCALSVVDDKVDHTTL